MTEREASLAFEPALERDGVKVSKSPWGPDDEIGRLNWITPESQEAVLGRLRGSKVFDLSVDYFIGMPSWLGAGDPKYDFWMTHTPHGSVIDNTSGAGSEVHRKYSYSGDSIAMYTHCGTHIDTLNHLGYFGCLWNGFTAEQHLGSRHWRVCGAEKYPPIVGRGVLLDVAGLHGVECLPDDHVIAPGELRDAAAKQGVEPRRGDVVLIRLGAMTSWPDFSTTSLTQPGIGLAAARYLCEEVGAMCVGADTPGLEAVPAEEPEAFLPVHGYMFATAGAQIMELVYMEQLAAEKVYEFAFIATPLKLTGATGSPMRPIAIPLD